MMVKIWRNVGSHIHEHCAYIRTSRLHNGVVDMAEAFVTPQYCEKEWYRSCKKVVQDLLGSESLGQNFTTAMLVLTRGSESHVQL